jgi:hypothetical protein
LGWWHQLDPGLADAYEDMLASLACITRFRETACLVGPSLDVEAEGTEEVDALLEVLNLILDVGNAVDSEHLSASSGGSDAWKAIVAPRSGSHAGEVETFAITALEGGRADATPAPLARPRCP